MLLPLIDNYIATPEISRWCRWIEFVLSFLSKKNRGLNLKVSNWKEEIFHQITNWNSRFSAITKFFVDMKLVVKSWHKSRHDLYQLTFLSWIIIYVKKKKKKKHDKYNEVKRDGTAFEVLSQSSLALKLKRNLHKKIPLLEPRLFWSTYIGL